MSWIHWSAIKSEFPTVQNLEEEWSSQKGEKGFPSIQLNDWMMPAHFSSSIDWCWKEKKKKKKNDYKSDNPIELLRRDTNLTWCVEALIAK